MTEHLPRRTLLRLLVVLAVVMAPHVMHVPWWCMAVTLLILLWRFLAAQQQWRMPPRPLKAAMAIAAFGSVYVTFGRVSGQTAGVAVLIMLSALKLTEMREKRDVIVLIFLMYFMLITHFLFSQEMWTILYLLISAMLITGVLIDVNHAGPAMPLKASLKMGATLVGQSLPLMIVLFILFPRIPGPLWGLPHDDGASMSGLSDTMSPGDISHLIESDAVAFRVTFLTPPPPRNELYWRGPVLEQTDGRKWTRIDSLERMRLPSVDLGGTPVTYEVVLEPTHQNWMFALDLLDASFVPPNAHLENGYPLVSADPVRDRMLYRLTSHPRYRLQPTLDPRDAERNLKLPIYANIKTKALARSWRESGLSDRAIIDKALAMYRYEGFYYTLNPPRLKEEAVDDFLFNTRRGFCEHYASSFTTLMRAAGIPARVVVGYQGGTIAAVGDYTIVRQSDAHAWSEVWLKDQGWVRVDPTAAVAPERVETGIAAALQESGTLPAFLNPTRHSSFRYELEARWDWVNERWNRWVLAYGPEVQQEFLSRFGLEGWQDLMLALTAIITVLLAIVGMAMMRSAATLVDRDPALQAWRRMLRKLDRRELRPGTSEGPRDFALRVARERPDLAPAIGRIAGLYLQLRYLVGPDRILQRQLDGEVAKLRT
jgi:transglutaminase-like putative cysteine protease